MASGDAKPEKTLAFDAQSILSWRAKTQLPSFMERTSMEGHLFGAVVALASRVCVGFGTADDRQHCRARARSARRRGAGATVTAKSPATGFVRGESQRLRGRYAGWRRAARRRLRRHGGARGFGTVSNKAVQVNVGADADDLTSRWRSRPWPNSHMTEPRRSSKRPLRRSAGSWIPDRPSRTCR